MLLFSSIPCPKAANLRASGHCKSSPTVVQEVTKSMESIVNSAFNMPATQRTDWKRHAFNMLLTVFAGCKEWTVARQTVATEPSSSCLKCDRRRADGSERLYRSADAC